MLPVAIGGAPLRPLELAPDAFVAGTIAGLPARIRVAADAPDLPILDPAMAMRAHLAAGPFQVGARIGPVRLTGRTAVVPVDLASGPSRRRVMWFDRGYAAGADAVVGPGGMPQPAVRFVLRPVAAGERTSILPLVDFGRGGVGTAVRIGPRRMKILFALDRHETIANAPAATLLAAMQGGRLTGPVTHASIRFGVARPVRPMRIDRPLPLGPLAIDRLLARTADGGIATMPGEAPDPDEIVVTARNGRPRGDPRLAIGAAALDRCSSILFDRPGRRIVLSCRATPSAA